MTCEAVKKTRMSSARLPVRRRIQQDQQQHAQAEVRSPMMPMTQARSRFCMRLKKRNGTSARSGIDPVELLDDSFE